MSDSYKHPDSSTNVPPADTPLLPDATGPRPLADGRDRLADALDRAAEEAQSHGHRMRRQPGLKGRVADAIVGAGEAADRSADYLRSVNLDSADEYLARGVRTVEERVRERPILMVACAAIAGFTLGRMFRD